MVIIIQHYPVIIIQGEAQIGQLPSKWLSYGLWQIEVQLMDVDGVGKPTYNCKAPSRRIIIDQDILLFFSQQYQMFYCYNILCNILDNNRYFFHNNIYFFTTILLHVLKSRSSITYQCPASTYSQMIMLNKELIQGKL